MVGFGRICYAEVPDLKEVFWEIEEQAWRWAGEDSVVKGLGADEGAVWEGELERAGGEFWSRLRKQVVSVSEADSRLLALYLAEIARDIFDLVIEGPEGTSAFPTFTITFLPSLRVPSCSLLFTPLPPSFSILGRRPRLRHLRHGCRRRRRRRGAAPRPTAAADGDGRHRRFGDGGRGDARCC